LDISGRYGYIIDDRLAGGQIFPVDLGGITTGTLNAGRIASDDIDVNRDVRINGDLFVGGGINAARQFIDWTAPSGGLSIANKPFIDVRSYGASPANSAAQNWAAFKNALNAAGGSTLYVEPGYYWIGGPLQTVVSTTRIQCDSPKNTTLAFNFPASMIDNPLTPPLITFGDGTVQMSGSGITGCGIVGTNTVTTGYEALRLLNIYQGTSSNLILYNAHKGVYASIGYGVELDDILVAGNGAGALGTSVGFDADSGVGVNVKDSTVMETGVAVALRAQGGAVLTVDNVYVWLAQTCFEHAFDTSIVYGYISRTLTCDTGNPGSGGQGMVITAIAPGGIYNFECRDCYFTQFLSNQAAVEFNAENGVINTAWLSRNQIFNNASTGLYVHGPYFHNLNITDSVITDNSNPSFGGTLGTRPDVFITNGANGVRIVGSKLGSTEGFSVGTWGPGANSLVSLTVNTGLATATTNLAHGLTTGNTVWVSGSGSALLDTHNPPPPYGQVITVTGANTFTFPTTASNGTYTNNALVIYAPTSNYAIQFGGASNDVDISNNQIWPTEYGPYIIAPASTSTNVTIANNPGYNPVGPGSISVTASPFTYTAGPSPETVYLSGTITSAVRGATTICPALVTGNCTMQLPPNGAVVVTYPAAAPTMVKDIQ
jgi:hypothetical protein